MGLRLPDKAGEIVNGDVAAWALVDKAAEAAGECQCESSCSLAELLSDLKRPIALSEKKNCLALGAEFDAQEAKDSLAMPREAAETEAAW